MPGDHTATKHFVGTYGAALDDNLAQRARLDLAQGLVEVVVPIMGIESDSGQTGFVDDVAVKVLAEDVAHLHEAGQQEGELFGAAISSCEPGVH